KRFRRKPRIEKLVILDGAEQNRGAVPVFLFRGRKLRPLLLAAAGKAAVARDMLDHDRARAPERAALPAPFAPVKRPGREADAGRHLLGTFEIFMRAVAQSLRIERDDALIAL